MFACIGDLHLGALHHLLPRLTRLQFETLDATLTAITERGVSEVIYLGDVFDVAVPSDHLIVTFMALLRKHAKLRHHIIPGNHDCIGTEVCSLDIAQRVCSWDAINGRVYRTPELVKIDGHRLWFCPQPHLKAAPKKVDYSIGHFAWTGARRDNGSVEAHGHQPKGRWLLGDYHTHQQGKRYTYAGTLFQKSFEEKLPKGYLLVEDDDVQFTEIRPHYELRRARIGKLAELKKLTREKGVYYKVICADGFMMPNGWQTERPNILAVTNDRKAKQPEKVEVAARVFAFDDPLEGLHDWLRQRKVLRRPEMLWAMQTAKQFAGHA